MTGQPSVVPPQETRWVVAFAGVWTVLLLTFTSFGAVVPVLPLLVLDERAGTPFAVGVVFALSGLVALLGRPYAGRAAQRWGTRPVMAAGCVLAAVAGGLYVAPLGLAGLYGVRVLTGVAESMVFTAGAVWTVALAPESRRGQLVGYYGLAMWSGFTLGPLVGVHLHGRVGYVAVWWLAAVAPLLAAGLLLCVPARPGEGGAVSRRLVPRSVLLPGAALALAASGYAALTGFVVLHLSARGVAGGGEMLSLFGLAYVGVRVLAGRLPDRVGATAIVGICGVVEGSGLLLIALADTWWLAAVGALVTGAGFTLLYPSLALIVIRRSSEAERSAAIGAYTSFWDLGLGLAGLLAGAVAGVGYSMVFVLAAALALVAGAVGQIAGHRAR